MHYAFALLGVGLKKRLAASTLLYKFYFKEKNKPNIIFKTGRFDNIDSVVIIRSLSMTANLISVLYSLAHTADDDSRIYVVETSRFRHYRGFIFPP